jgi:hypothetical protein
LLIQFGADPSLKNKLGKTPADYVRDDGMLALLRRSGKAQKRAVRGART